MKQLKFPNRPITKPQIKKIHTLVNLVGLNDDMYRALLFRFDVESSTELTREKASWVIETLQGFLEEFGESSQIPTNEDYSKLVYFNRDGKATDKQIEYIKALWTQVSNKKDYSSLMGFIKNVVGVLYLNVESLKVQEASNVIVALEKWNKQKEINL